MYTTTIDTVELTIDSFLKDYVDINKFLGTCKSCPNYENIWSCPPFDFDPEEYWKKYSKIKIYAHKLIFPKDYINKILSEDEAVKIINEVHINERKKTAIFLNEIEAENSNITALHAGCCFGCQESNCSRQNGNKCRHPEKLRYSIESLGGDITKITKDLFSFEIQWRQKNKLPDYLTQVYALLYK